MKQVSLKVMNDIVMDNRFVLSAQVSVTIVNMNGKYIVNEFSTDNCDYVTVNMNPRLIVKFEEKGTSWNVSKQITFNRKYFYRFQLGMKNFYKYIQNCDNYIYDDDGYLERVVKNDTDVMRIEAESQWIIFEPEILFVNNVKIPGVMVTINDPQNVIVISIDEYESMCATIVSLNLNVIGCNLLTLHEHMTDVKGYDRLKQIKERSVPKTEGRRTGSPSLFDNQPTYEPSDDSIVSGPIFETKPESLDDL